MLHDAMRLQEYLNEGKVVSVFNCYNIETDQGYLSVSIEFIDSNNLPIEFTVSQEYKAVNFIDDTYQKLCDKAINMLNEFKSYSRSNK